MTTHLCIFLYSIFFIALLVLVYRVSSITKGLSPVTDVTDQHTVWGFHHYKPFSIIVGSPLVFSLGQQV